MNLTVASSPHIRSRLRTDRLMLDVVIALIPALSVGAFVLGARSLLVAAVSVIAAELSEYLWCKIKKEQNTLYDMSALVTGLLLAMTLPVTVPLWQAALGSVFSIIVVKKMFGGLGQNIFNPALSGRAFMLLIFPLGVTHYPLIDAASSATPLHRMVIPSLPAESLFDMFIGNCPGSIGEISAPAIIAGGIYLVVRKVINPKIPLAFIGTLAILSLIFSKTENSAVWSAYSVLSGGAMLGAVFMATDYTTSPVTSRGQVIYGIGCGALTLVFRYFGLYPEGVTYAILVMNVFTWIIDRYTGFARFGTRRGGSA